MFRRCLPRQKKRHVLYVFMTSVLGITLYCTICLHFSQTCRVALMNIKHHHFTKRSNRQLHFLWDCFMGSPLTDVNKIRRKKSKKSSETSQDNQKEIVIDNRISLSNFENSKSIIDKQKFSDVEIQNILGIKNAKQGIQKNMKAGKLKASNNLLTSVVQNRSVPINWLPKGNQNRDHLPSKPSKYLMNVSDHSCKPLYPQFVLYNRIFKTASTTMSSFLEKCSRKLKYRIKKDLTEEWSNEKISHPILRRIQEKAKRSKRRHKRLLAVSHFYFRIDSGLKMKHTYINLLREPVERFISHYYYARSPNRWAKRLRRVKALGHWNVTLEQCLAKQYEGCKWNTMTRFFCGPEAFCKRGNSEALSQAKNNMLRYYSSIGVVEYLNEFIKVLHKRLPKFIIRSPRILGKTFVTTGVKRTPISNNLMARVKQVNQADIELYNYAKTLFFKQAKQCAIKV